MRIIITGSPGTGKTTIAKLLSERMGIGLISIKRVVDEAGLSRGRKHEVDIGELREALSFLEKKDDYVIEGHLASELRLPSDFIFVLRTHPRELRRRMERRGYGKRKIEENLMAEMLDYCLQRVEAEYGKRPLELDTTGRSPEESAMGLEDAIKHNKKKLDSVDYSSELRRHLGLRKVS